MRDAGSVPRGRGTWQPGEVGTESAAALRRIRTLTGTAPEIDLDALPDLPEDLFDVWLEEALAAGVPEPIAVSLATVDPDGVPDVRTLLLKDVDERGWARSRAPPPRARRPSSGRALRRR